jgi:hypothetical protein
MPHIQIPKLFLKNERHQLYANWPPAFWRELVQNGVDAGAINITIRLTEEENLVHVYFGDDGPGMTREVLESVYFRLGETTKLPDDAVHSSFVGGFGRARILTCFSMLRYTLRTQGWLVEGDGPEYTIDAADYVEGCHLDIMIDDCTLIEMEVGLRSFLRQSDVPCNIIFNGVAWQGSATRGVRVARLHLDDREFASVFVNPQGLIYHLIVRCRGLQTFFQMSRVPSQVIIEIEPSLVREVLTGNRDAFAHRYRLVLDKFIEEMTLNSSSLRQSSRASPVWVAATTFLSKRGDEIPSEIRDVFIYSEDGATTDSTLHGFLPGTWRQEHKRLMVAWTAACFLAIDAMLKITQMPDINWAVGWNFGSDEAITKRHNNLHVLCINPFDQQDEPWARKIDALILRRLLALAKHETAHILYLSHDEDYARFLTDLDAEVDPAQLPVKISLTIAEDGRSGALVRDFSPNHRRVLLIIEEFHPAAVPREKIKEVWNKRFADAINGNQQHPLDGRLNELVKTASFGESILQNSGKQVFNGRMVDHYCFTEAGWQRWQASRADMYVVPDLPEEAARHLATVKTTPGLHRLYEGILRAGPGGVTFKKLIHSTWMLQYPADTNSAKRLQDAGLVELNRPDLIYIATWYKSGH